MKNIFITGATGFVGLHLNNYLRKHNLIVSAGARNSLSPEIINYGDLGAKINWIPLLKNIDVVVHLAARVHVMHETTNSPLTEFMKINCDASVQLAQSAKTAGVKRFIYLSSVKVNGEQTIHHPYQADDTPAPEDDYGRSKWAAEVELLKLHEPGKFEIVIIRPPLIYGQNVKANFANLMKVVKKGIPLPFSLVKNKRSVVSVLNLCDLIYTCCSHPAAGGQIFLVSDDKDLSLPEMIQKMAYVQGRKTHLIPVPVTLMTWFAKLLGRGSYATRLFGNLQVDIEKTKKQLHWQPPFTFEDTYKN